MSESESTGVGGAETLAQCEAHEHLEMHIVDEVIDINIDELFQHLFTDSQFYTEFTRRRHTSGLSACLCLSLKSASTCTHLPIPAYLAHCLVSSRQLYKCWG